jgi:hypothetical protein
MLSDRNGAVLLHWVLNIKTADFSLQISNKSQNRKIFTYSLGFAD